jgi:DNA topoisomerase-1
VKVKVLKYNVKESSSKAYAPFTTSTLYQMASSNLGWGADKTARVAQSLYESGLCTYIRSDSIFIVPDFIQSIRSEIPTKYGSTYLPSQQNYFSNKANAQEAHEAIRVTDITLTNASGADESKLYTLIYKRTIASQMEDMRQLKGSAEFVCDKYQLSATGSKVIFDGWRKAWDYGTLEDSELPVFEIDEEVKVISTKTEQKFTQPPSRYSDQSIIKEMESLGIGRPSTYATTIKTLIDRKYIEKQQKSISVTEIGTKVSEFLVLSNFCFMDLQFTANLENKLDCIASGDCNKVCELRIFWERLQSDIENSKRVLGEASNTGYSCPKCSGFLVMKHSKYGSFYTCSNRLDKESPCDYKCDVGENNEPKEKERTIKEIAYSEICCPNCNEPFIIRTSKNNKEYLGCRNFAKDKGCEGFFGMDGVKMEFKKKKFKKWKKKK